MRLDTTKQATRDNFTGWYTRKQLAAAFKQVQNPKHWKGPIDSFCRESEMDLVSEAIIFFTATIPTFYRLGQTSKYRVQAVGYWEGPAGP